MSDKQKPSDSADKAAGGAFLAWVASHPTATLASKEEARLLDEIDRLRDENTALRERLATAELKLDFTTAVSQPQWVPPPQTGWVCPVCGKGNAPWNLSCSCKQTIVKQEVGRE